MKRNAINYSLGPLEREVLQIAWKSNKVCVRHVLEQLGKKEGPAYTTVMTVMNRMVDKGILKREKESNTCYYAVSQSKTAFYHSLVATKVDTLIHNYGTEIVPTLKGFLRKI